MGGGEGAAGSKCDALKCMQDAARNEDCLKERVERLVKIYPANQINFSPPAEKNPGKISKHRLRD